MLHASVFWLPIMAFLSTVNVNLGNHFYMTVLTSVVALLALTFLIAGFVVFFARRGLSQSRQVATPPPPLSNKPWQNANMTPILALIIPAIILCASASLNASASFGATLTPTPVSKIVFTPTAPVSPPVKDLVVPGVLTIGSDTTFPPETYRDSNGAPTGFDIDLITAIAKQMNLSVNIKSMPFNDLLNNLNNKTFDVVISAYAVTDPKTVAQAIPYLNPKDTFLILKNNPAHLKFDTSTDLCGQTIGVQANTSEKTEVDKLVQRAQCPTGTPITVTQLLNADDAANALLQQTVDALYQSTPTVSYYQQKYPNTFQTLGKLVKTPQEGIIIRIGDQAMFNAVTKAYNLLVNDGTYSTFLQKWGLSADGITPK